MFNRERTKEIYGYDIDLSVRRRTTDEIDKSGNIHKKDLLVVDNCPVCNKERTIKLRSSMKNRPCSKCFHNSVKMLDVKHSQKGKIVSEETKNKMSKNHYTKKGIPSFFKGKAHTEESKIKLSVAQTSVMEKMNDEEKLRRSIKASTTLRDVSIEEFDGFVTDENLRFRGSKEYKEWEEAVIERDQHCQFPGCLERRRGKLLAHHLDAFSWAVDKRVDINNGVTLCQYHHSHGPQAFHNMFGKKDNTKQEYSDWVNIFSIPPQKDKTIYIVTGAPGSGKTWVCSQIVDKFNYIPYDDFPKEQHLHLLLNQKRDVPILYDPWRKATSFLKRYKEVFNVKFVVIVEDDSVIKSRILARGGEITDKITRYAKRAKNIAKIADFAGTSQEVLDYLKNI